MKNAVMILHNTPEMIKDRRDEIRTDKNKTMLWSGGIEPFPLLNSDESPQLWTEENLEWAKRNNLEDRQRDIIEVGKPVVVNNYDGEQINEYIAREANKETLGMALDRLQIKLPDYDWTDPNSIACWETASQIWAENAKGEVGVSVGEVIKDKSIFVRIEFDIIKNNAAVDALVVYDIWPFTAGGKAPKTYLREEFEKITAQELALEPKEAAMV